MPRGTLSKTDMKWKIIQLLNQLDEASYQHDQKELTRQYLHWLLDYTDEFSN